MALRKPTSDELAQSEAHRAPDKLQDALRENTRATRVSLILLVANTFSTVLAILLIDVAWFTGAVITLTGLSLGNYVYVNVRGSRIETQLWAAENVARLKDAEREGRWKTP